MTSAHPYPRRWQALAVIATAQFLVIMDTSIIGVALPDMQESLGFLQRCRRPFGVAPALEQLTEPQVCFR